MLDSLSTSLVSFLAYVHIPQGHGPSGIAPGSNMFLWIAIIGTLLVSWFVQSKLKSRFQEYSGIPLPLSGKDVAEKMLSDNHIYDVQVVSTPGFLSDHYNPATKTVNLSEGVYYGQHVAAAAVAAHEVGHALQHAQAYAWLSMRSKLVPVVQISSHLVQWVLILGMLLFFATQNKWVLGAGVVMLAMSTLFAFVTLPVEFNASSRALQWMTSSRVGGYLERSKAQNALFWAAMTYVVAALSSLAILLHYLSIFLGRRN